MKYEVRRGNLIPQDSIFVFDKKGKAWGLLDRETNEIVYMSPRRSEVTGVKRQLEKPVKASGGD